MVLKFFLALLLLDRAAGERGAVLNADEKHRFRAEMANDARIASSRRRDSLAISIVGAKDVSPRQAVAATNDERCHHRRVSHRRPLSVRLDSNGSNDSGS